MADSKVLNCFFEISGNGGKYIQIWFKNDKVTLISRRAIIVHEDKMLIVKSC